MNTPHEGHHRGLKASPSGPKKHHSLLVATKKTIDMSYLSALKFVKTTSRQKHSNPLFSNTPTCPHVTTFIESLIREQLNLR